MTTTRINCLILLLGAANAVALPVSGVVTADDEVAIEGANVLVWAEDALAAEAKTDKRGRFAIAELRAGVYRVAIEAEGFVPHDIAELPVPKGGAAPAVRVALAPAVFIAGVVTDGGGEAVVDAVVETTRPGGRALQAQTDAKGRFRLGPLADGDEVGINVDAAGVGRALRWAAVAPRDDLHIHIRGSGALRGRVVDSESGLPLDDFHMTIATLGGDGKIRAKRFRSADGVFAWEGLPPGRFAATFSADGYQLHAVRGFEMPQDGTDIESVVAMNPGASVRGRVVDVATGVPIAGALVTAREGATVLYRVWSKLDANLDVEKPFGIASARTDAEGAFVLRQLPQGTVTVRARAKGYLSATAVAQPDDEVSIELSTSATLRGWLVDEEGRATDGMVVLWHPFNSERRTAAATAETGFAFEQVASGRYRLWGHTPRLAERWPFEEDQAGVEIVVSPDDEVVETEATLTAAEGCDLTGTVRDLPAGETASVELTHFNHVARRRRVVNVDEAGRFTLNIRPGAVRVRAETSAGRTLTQRVDAPCSTGDELDFRFDGQWRLHGTVTRQGEPAQVMVRVRSRANSEECGFGRANSRETAKAGAPPDCPPMRSDIVNTSPSGQFAIRGLREGTYELEVLGTDHRREVRVVSDTRADVHLLDDERQVLFAGVLTDADTQRPLAGVYVSLRKAASGPTPSFAHNTSTDTHGKFAMRITPDTYRIFANKPGFAAQWRDLAISETTPVLAISLARPAGAAVRFTDAKTGQPLPFVSLFVDDQIVPLRLTKEGTANLWDYLEGRDLSFRHLNYREVPVPRWNGAALDIKMRR